MQPKSNIGSSRRGCVEEMIADLTHLSMIWPTGTGLRAARVRAEQPRPEIPAATP